MRISLKEAREITIQGTKFPVQAKDEITIDLIEKSIDPEIVNACIHASEAEITDVAIQQMVADAMLLALSRGVVFDRIKIVRH